MLFAYGQESRAKPLCDAIFIFPGSQGWAYRLAVQETWLYNTSSKPNTEEDRP